MFLRGLACQSRQEIVVNWSQKNYLLVSEVSILINICLLNIMVRFNSFGVEGWIKFIDQCKFITNRWQEEDCDPLIFCSSEIFPDLPFGRKQQMSSG